MIQFSAYFINTVLEFLDNSGIISQLDSVLCKQIWRGSFY